MKNKSLRLKLLTKNSPILKVLFNVIHAFHLYNPKKAYFNDLTI